MSGNTFNASAAGSGQRLSDNLKRPARIATKTEVERLEAMRQRATPQMRLRPDYVDHARVDHSLLNSHEWRIQNLKDRLGEAQGRLQEDRKNAVHKDRAKSAFNRKSRTPVYAATQNMRKTDRGWER